MPKARQNHIKSAKPSRQSRNWDPWKERPLHLSHTWSTEDNENVGLYGEFPLLGWLAPTPDKALSGIQRLVRSVVADMHSHRKDGAQNVLSVLSSAPWLILVKLFHQGTTLLGGIVLRSSLTAGGGCAAAGTIRAGGKSGLHRAGWWVTPTGGDPRESATENRPPTSPVSGGRQG